MDRREGVGMVTGDVITSQQPEGYRGSMSCTGPRACYDEGKRVAETLTSDYRRRHGVDARIARIFNTYGPGMRADDGRVVVNLVLQARRGAALTRYGNGRQTRSFCYVDDLIAGLRALMSAAAAPGPVNLGNPEETSVRALAERVLALTGGPGRLAFRPLPVDDPARRCPDIGLARRTLGWLPRVPLQAGLLATIAYFRGRMRASGVQQAAS